MGKMKDNFFDNEDKVEPDYQFIDNLSDEDIAYEMDIVDDLADEEIPKIAIDIPEFGTEIAYNERNDDNKYIVDIPKRTIYPNISKGFYSYKAPEQRFYEDGIKYQDEVGEICKEVPLFTYFPTYDSLSKSQLAWYFYWRSQCRQGKMMETSLSYFFLYSYELINLIGCKDKQEALGGLIDIFKSTKNNIDHSVKYFASWIKDFIIFYECESDYLQIIGDLAGDEVGGIFPLETLTNFFDNGESVGLMNALNVYSDYNVLKSKFFQDENIPIFNECTTAVLLAFNNLYLKKNKMDFIKKWNKSDTSHRYFPFELAIFFQREDIRIEKPREINRYLSFWRESNHMMTSMQNNLQFNLRWRKYVTGILRCIDANLRNMVNFKWKIRSIPLSEKQKEIVEKAMSEHLKDYNYIPSIPSEKTNSKGKVIEVVQKKKKIEFTVDMLKIDDLHSESDKIRDKLILEQGFSEPLKEAPISPDEAIVKVNDQIDDRNPAPNNQWPRLYESFTEIQKEVLKIIVLNKNSNALLTNIESKEHVFIDVVIDEMNEKAFEIIGDSIIDMNENEPCIFEDYRTDIGGIING